MNTEVPRKEIEMNIGELRYKTGLMKLGAIIGDNCQIGVNTLIFPGRKISTGSILQPGTVVKEDFI
ncbi:MAG: hypothetical protein ACTSSG_02225 [Candidatus Heimdallarchaeaceae archaeon]